MVDKEFAVHFAEEWIAAWNSHDLDRILSHYSEDLAFSGPFVTRVTGEASGVLKGKEHVRSYWAKALQLVPELRFELIDTLLGINSVVLYYKNARGLLNAEVFEFDADGRVCRSAAHGAV